MHTNNTMVVNAWVGLYTGCHFTFKVHDSEGTYITVDNTTETPFEFFFHRDALQDFLTHAHTAIAQMNTLATEETTGNNNTADNNVG